MTSVCIEVRIDGARLTMQYKDHRFACLIDDFYGMMLNDSSPYKLAFITAHDAFALQLGVHEDHGKLCVSRLADEIRRKKPGMSFWTAGDIILINNRNLKALRLGNGDGLHIIFADKSLHVTGGSHERDVQWLESLSHGFNLAHGINYNMMGAVAAALMGTTTAVPSSSAPAAATQRAKRGRPAA